MAGHGRTLAILAVVLVAGVSAAIWLATSGGEGEPASTHDGVVEAPTESTSKTATAARPRKLGTATVFGEIRRSAGKAPVVGQPVVLAPERGERWTVETDAQGAFRFEHVPNGGPYELSAAAKGCGTIRIPGIALDRNQRRNVGTLYLDPSVRLEVRVRSTGDAPVEGAVVEAFPIAQGVDYDWSKASAQIGQAPVSVARTTTDAKGGAVFPEMAVGDWTFTAKKPGFATGGARSVTLSSDEAPRPVTIVLWPGHPLDGRVHGPDGAPVAGALVMANAPESEWDLAAAPMRARVTADAEGRYAFVALDTGEKTLWVGRPGKIPEPVATVRVPLVRHYDLVLKGSGTLTGVVTTVEDGTGVEGAAVRARWWERGGSHVGEAVTDAEGRYSLEMTAGSISVDVEKENFVQMLDAPPGGGATETTLRAGETAVRNVRLRRGARLSGVVKGADGPLAGAKVQIVFPTQGGGYDDKTVETDSDGRYTLGSLDKGRMIVVAAKPGWFQADEPGSLYDALRSPGTAEDLKVDVPESGEAKKDVELRRGAAVVGRVEGADGTPIAGAKVSAPGAADSMPTGPDGTFRLEGVTPGDAVDLVAAKFGFLASPRAPIVVAVGAPTTDVVLRMFPQGRVRGTVTTASGAPPGEAVVLLAAKRDDDSSWLEQTRWRTAVRVPVRPDGTWDEPMPFAPPGNLLVRAVSPDAATGDAPAVPITEGRDLYEVQVALGDGVELAGKVVAKSGDAVAGADVSIALHHSSDSTSYGGEDAAHVVWAVTDATGAFRVPHVPAEKYDVRAAARGFVAAVASFDTATAHDVTVTLAPELTTEGVVVFSDGSPVEGVQVEAQTDAAVAFGDDSDGVRPTAVTDAQGRFRLHGLGDGQFPLTVAGPWSNVNVRTKTVAGVAAGSKDVRIVVERGGTIAGRVIDSKRRPVPNASIYADPSAKEGVEPGAGEERSADSREDGTFTLAGLAEGPYDIQTTNERLRAKTLEKVAVGTKNLEILLDEGLSISGQIVDEDGRPLERVSVEPWRDPEIEDAYGSNQYTDRFGRFTISGLPPGDYRIVLSFDGAADGRVLDNRLKFAAGTAGLRLVAIKGASISGTVVDESGGPVAQAVVSVSCTETARVRFGKSGKDGAFAVVGLVPAPTYEVRAQMPGRISASRSDVAADARDVKLMLAKGFSATGRVVDAAGKPLPTTQIRFQLPGGTQPETAETDAEGRFSIDSLANETYEASVCVSTGGNNYEWKTCGTVKAGASDVELRAAR